MAEQSSPQVAPSPLPAHSARSVSLRSVVRRVNDPSVSLLLSQVAAAAAAMVANVLAARGLAPSGRGEIALLLQLSYLCTAAVLLGSDRSFVLSYYGSSSTEAVQAYLRLLWRPAGLAMVAAVLALLVPGPSAFFRVSVVLVLCFAVVNAFVRAVKQTSIAARRPREFLANTVITQILLIAGMAGLFVAGVRSSTVWMGAYVLSAVLPTAGYFVRRARVLRERAPHADATPDDRPRRVRREGLALLPAALANMAMLRIDRLLLAGLGSTTALGLYATVATLTEMLAWPLAAYADSRVGAWRIADREGRFRPARFLWAAAGFAVLGGAALGTAAYLMVEPLFGERYGPARELVAPLVVAAAVYAVARVSIATLVARGRTAWVSTAETVGFVVSLVAYVLLIPRFGALGAAYGSLVGYSACLVATLAVLYGSQRSPRSMP